MMDLSMGEPFAVNTYDLVNVTGCVPTKTVVELFSKTVLMQDAINVATGTFILGMIWGVVLIYIFRRKKDAPE